MAATATRILCVLVPCQIAVAPILRDGPLNVDLWPCKAVIALALGLAAAVLMPGKRPGLASRRASPAILIHLALIVVCCCLSDTPELSFDATWAVVTSTIVFLTFDRSASARWIRNGLLAAGASLVLVAAVALLQMLVIRNGWGHPVLLHLLPPESRVHFFEMDNTVGQAGVRLASVFFHSNQLGHFSAISFAFFMPMLVYGARGRVRLACGAALVLAVACIFVAQSRGAILVIVVQVLTAIILGYRPSFATARTLLVVGGLGAACVLLFFRENLVPFLERLATFSLSSREILWERSLSLATAHPMFGVGPGCSSHAILSTHPPVDVRLLLDSYYARVPYDAWSNNPHNHYLTALMETGVLGLLLQVGAYGYYFVRAVSILNSSRAPIIRSLAITAATVLGGEFVRGLFEAYCFLSAPETGVHVAFVLALVAFLDRRGPRTGRSAVQRRSACAA